MRRCVPCGTLISRWAQPLSSPLTSMKVARASRCVSPGSCQGKAQPAAPGPALAACGGGM
eukprot:4320296-Alexandrium_andersonii.AAC.1